MNSASRHSDNHGNHYNIRLQKAICWSFSDRFWYLPLFKFSSHGVSLSSPKQSCWRASYAFWVSSRLVHNATFVEFDIIHSPVSRWGALAFNNRHPRSLLSPKTWATLASCRLVACVCSSRHLDCCQLDFQPGGFIDLNDISFFSPLASISKARRKAEPSHAGQVINQVTYIFCILLFPCNDVAVRSSESQSKLVSLRPFSRL